MMMMPRSFSTVPFPLVDFHKTLDVECPVLPPGGLLAPVLRRETTPATAQAEAEAAGVELVV